MNYANNRKQLLKETNDLTFFLFPKYQLDVGGWKIRLILSNAETVCLVCGGQTEEVAG